MNCNDKTYDKFCHLLLLLNFSPPLLSNRPSFEFLPKLAMLWLFVPFNAIFEEILDYFDICQHWPVSWSCEQLTDWWTKCSSEAWRPILFSVNNAAPWQLQIQRRHTRNTRKYKKYKEIQEIQSAPKKPEANFIVSQQGTLTTVAKYREEIQEDKTEILKSWTPIWHNSYYH